MTPATDTDHCPHWCARDHTTERRGRAFYHASKTCSVTISTAGRPGFPERADVETAQYIPDDPGEAPWTPTVELTLHAGSRYRVIGLTPAEARQLATMLARAADLTGRSGRAAGPVTVDQRGHGESDWAPDGDYGIGAYARGNSGGHDAPGPGDVA